MVGEHKHIQLDPAAVQHVRLQSLQHTCVCKPDALGVRGCLELEWAFGQHRCAASPGAVWPNRARMAGSSIRNASPVFVNDVLTCWRFRFRAINAAFVVLEGGPHKSGVSAPTPTQQCWRASVGRRTNAQDIQTKLHAHTWIMIMCLKRSSALTILWVRTQNSHGG